MVVAHGGWRAAWGDLLPGVALHSLKSADTDSSSMIHLRRFATLATQRADTPHRSNIQQTGLHPTFRKFNVAKHLRS